MNESILKNVFSDNLVCFVGAGVSTIPPSCLPSWWQMNHAILDSLAEVSSMPETRILTELIKRRETDGKLPPEFVSELIANRFPKSYFEVLRALEGETPNEIHLWLAVLAKEKLVKAIITTNFDTLIEKAFAQINCPLRSCISPHEYEETLVDLNSKKDIPCLLLKLHGTAEQPDTCIDTLAQRKKGLHQSVTNLLNYLGVKTFWLFLGYSGADLEAEPNYLGIRARRNDSNGFGWLLLPGANPLPSLKDLVDHYGPDKAILEYGTLPDWFTPITLMLHPNTINFKIPALTEQQIIAVRNDSHKLLLKRTTKWAQDCGSGESALVLSDLAVYAGFYNEAHTLLNTMINNLGDLALTTIGKALVYQALGKIEKHFGNSQIASEYYSKALQFYRECNEHEGIFLTYTDYLSILADLGKYDDARKILEQQLTYARQVGDDFKLIDVLKNSAYFYFLTGSFKESLTIGKEALKLAESTGLEYDKGQILLNMADVEQDAKFKSTYISDALTIFQRLGHDGMISEALRKLAQNKWRESDVDSAFTYLNQAKELADRVGDYNRKIHAAYVQADFLAQLGNFDDAINLYSQSYAEAEKTSNSRLGMVILQNLGIAQQSKGDLSTAIKTFEKGLQVSANLGDNVRTAGFQNNLGIVLELKGDLDKAINYYNASISTFEATGDLTALAGAYGNIANINYRKSLFTEAKSSYLKTLSIFEKLDDINGILRTIYNLANVIYALNEVQEASYYYEKAINLASKYKQPMLKDNFEINYANVLFQQKDYQNAITRYKTVIESSTKRKDFNLAGLASYYAGLCYAQLREVEPTISLLEQAITLWKEMPEPPNTLKTVQDQLDQIKNQLKS